MLHAPAPRHLRNVNQALDARLKFYKCAVIGYTHDPPQHPRLYRIAFLDVLPGIRRHLLQPEGNALFGRIELEHFYSDLLARLDHRGRVSDVAVAQVADMQQSVDTAQIDECAVIREILHYSSDDRAL